MSEWKTADRAVTSRIGSIQRKLAEEGMVDELEILSELVDFDVEENREVFMTAMVIQRLGGNTDFSMDDHTFIYHGTMRNRKPGTPSTHRKRWKPTPAQTDQLKSHNLIFTTHHGGDKLPWTKIAHQFRIQYCFPWNLRCFRHPPRNQCRAAGLKTSQQSHAMSPIHRNKVEYPTGSQSHIMYHSSIHLLV
ncbi:hypothetical protein BLNAU_8352 [Blattamonas nauphoetae]|uniref:Uncharacterized protein n=1 Tax=Blattamonas nauphoetae TaxID=2049346 RepID=A0ABQ9XYY9_9EUKA|nr:hypothetical protein BLNAU_8352 [Blattamonas nauphoetae]